MSSASIKLFLAGMFLVMAFGVQSYAQPSGSQPREDGESAALMSQARSLKDRELLERAEQRSEALWSRLFEIQMQEIELRTRIEDLEYRSSPEGIGRALAFVGSVRPMDELRVALRNRLEGEKARLTGMLDVLASSRERIESAIQDADAQVERLSRRLNSIQ